MQLMNPQFYRVDGQKSFISLVLSSLAQIRQNPPMPPKRQHTWRLLAQGMTVAVTGFYFGGKLICLLRR